MKLPYLKNTSGIVKHDDLVKGESYFYIIEGNEVIFYDYNYMLKVSTDEEIEIMYNEGMDLMTFMGFTEIEPNKEVNVITSHYRPSCDSCKKEIYPCVSRVFNGCCTECYDRLFPEDKERDNEVTKNFIKLMRKKNNF